MGQTSPSTFHLSPKCSLLSRTRALSHVQPMTNRNGNFPLIPSLPSWWGQREGMLDYCLPPLQICWRQPVTERGSIIPSNTNTIFVDTDKDARRKSGIGTELFRWRVSGFGFETAPVGKIDLYYLRIWNDDLVCERRKINSDMTTLKDIKWQF